MPARGRPDSIRTGKNMERPRARARGLVGASPSISREKIRAKRRERRRKRRRRSARPGLTFGFQRHKGREGGRGDEEEGGRTATTCPDVCARWWTTTRRQRTLGMRPEKECRSARARAIYVVAMRRKKGLRSPSPQSTIYRLRRRRYYYYYNIISFAWLDRV